jgi:hypothetical protein
MASAVESLEDLATSKKKSTLVLEDVKGYLLCEDAMSSLRKGRNGTKSDA